MTIYYDSKRRTSFVSYVGRKKHGKYHAAQFYRDSTLRKAYRFCEESGLNVVSRMMVQS